MKITKRRLQRIIKEEYTRLKRQGLISEMGFRDMRHSSSKGHMRGVDHDNPNMMEDNYDAAVKECMAAIPGMMKKIISMGMGHTVMNDVYHICEPICRQYGVSADDVSEEIMERLGY